MNRESYSVLRGAEVWDRLEHREPVRKWAGGYAFLAELDGMPCFAVNEAAMADYLDEEDRGIDLCPVLRFETAENRDAYVRAWLRPLLRHEREKELGEAVPPRHDLAS